MPTYFVNTSNIKIKKSIKEKIAIKITNIHNKATGANKYFAQVIFNEAKRGAHYMGGKIVLKPEIFIYGHIRSGRTAKVKNKLLTGLREVIIKNTRLKKDNIWVYILDLKPSQMIEYGEILPKSGGEKKWFKNLPINLKKRLNEIDN
tara:strand:- start:241 stop:681 length:441 start_codon:yes stop_codon:yes gene_type:complete